MEALDRARKIPFFLLSPFAQFSDVPPARPLAPSPVPPLSERRRVRGLLLGLLQLLLPGGGHGRGPQEGLEEHVAVQIRAQDEHRIVSPRNILLHIFFKRKTQFVSNRRLKYFAPGSILNALSYKGEIIRHAKMQKKYTNKAYLS